MDAPPLPLRTLIEKFLEEEDRDALREACRLAASTADLDLSCLLDFVQNYPADRMPKAEALRRLRTALHLPAMPGPVCRPTPFD